MASENVMICDPNGREEPSTKRPGKTADGGNNESALWGGWVCGKASEPEAQ